MAIIIDLKNAIRKAIYTQDDTINFNFNEILVVEYPYVFFYIPSFKIDKAIDAEYWRKVTLMCVIEYAKEENSSSSDLWGYSDILTEAYKAFDFADTKLTAKNIEFKTVEDVLQMTFELEFYVKAEDETELMKELNLNMNAI